jgi:hypothetical protein
MFKTYEFGITNQRVGAPGNRGLTLNPKSKQTREVIR